MQIVSLFAVVGEEEEEEEKRYAIFYYRCSCVINIRDKRREIDVPFYARATERLSLVDGDDENANSDDNADCKIVSNNESPTPPANKKKERKRKRGEFAQTPSFVMYLLYTKPHLF